MNTPDYERFRPEDSSDNHRVYMDSRATAIAPPRLGAIMGGLAAFAAIIATIFTAIWAYAGVSFAANAVPGLLDRQHQDSQDIAQLKIEQGYTDTQFKQILNNLDKLGDKIDMQNDRISNLSVQQHQDSKQLRGWQK
jgi:hypothetical protein